MAARTTVLTPFSDQGNSNTTTLSGHTIAKPRVCVQTRRVANGSSGIAEDSFRVTFGTEDSLGNLLATKVSMTVTLRRPANGIAADVDLVVAAVRDILAGDEYDEVVSSQSWL